MPFRAGALCALLAACGAARLPCSLTTPAGDAYDLSPLGALAATDRDGNRYSVDVCGDAPAAVASCAGGEADAASYQNFHGSCHLVADAAHRAPLAPLQDGELGVLVAIGGGSACGSTNRSLNVRVECADRASASISLEESKTTSCLYEAVVRSRAGCPLGCARDGRSGAVCGGIVRGACAASSNGAACACAAGLSGPLCVRPAEVPSGAPAVAAAPTFSASPNHRALVSLCVLAVGVVVALFAFPPSAASAHGLARPRLLAIVLSAWAAAEICASPAARISARAPLLRACTRKPLAVVVAAFLARPEPILELNIANIHDFYGSDADFFVVNNGGAGTKSAALINETIARVGLPVTAIDNNDHDVFGYDFGALRAAARSQRWSARCVPYEHVMHMQLTSALILPINVSRGLSPFRPFLWFWEDAHIAGELLPFIMTALHSLGLEYRAPCMATFGPSFVIGGDCLQNFLAARVFDTVVSSDKDTAGKMERVTPMLARELCGFDCRDGGLSVDGHVWDYPDAFSNHYHGPSEPVMQERHFLKRWASLGRRAARSRPRDDPDLRDRIAQNDCCSGSRSDVRTANSHRWC